MFSEFFQRKQQLSQFFFSPADFIIKAGEAANQCELSQLSKTHIHSVMRIMGLQISILF